MSENSNPNPSPTPTPDELVSMYIDDQATPQQRAQVEDDPALLARAEQFLQVGRLVSAPVSSASRSETIAGALAAYDQLHPAAAAQPTTAQPTTAQPTTAQPTTAQRIFEDDDEDFRAAHLKSAASRRQTRFGRAVPAFVGLSVLAVLALVSVAVLLINEGQDSTETAEKVIEVADEETADGADLNATAARAITPQANSATAEAVPDAVPDAAPEIASAPAPPAELDTATEEADSADSRTTATDDAAVDDSSTAFAESEAATAPATPQVGAQDLGASTASSPPLSQAASPTCPDDDLPDDDLVDEDLLEENATQTSIEAEVDDTNVEETDASNANAAAPDSEATDPAPTQEPEPETPSTTAPTRDCP